MSHFFIEGYQWKENKYARSNSTLMNNCNSCMSFFINVFLTQFSKSSNEGRLNSMNYTISSKSYDMSSDKVVKRGCILTCCQKGSGERKKTTSFIP